MLAWVLLGCTGDAPKEAPPVEDTAVDTGGECAGPYADLFDEVWDVLQAEYPYFELKGVDWHQLRAECRPDTCADDMTYRRFLNRGMDCLLSPLADHHVYIVDTDGEAHGYGLSGATPNSSPGVADAYLEGGGVVFGASAHVTAGVLSGTGALYVRVESWADVDDVDFGDVLALAPEASGYVVDVRANVGGNEGIAQRLAGALIGGADAPYSWARYRDERDGDPYTYEMTEPAGISIAAALAANAVEPRPIALLIGEKCMSSCEGFVSMMTSSPLTRSFGATTRGSTGNPEAVTLSDGTVLASSRWYLTRGDGVTPVEGQGFAPDAPVAYTGVGGTDEVLEAALAWLSAE